MFTMVFWLVIFSQLIIPYEVKASEPAKSTSFQRLSPVAEDLTGMGHVETFVDQKMSVFEQEALCHLTPSVMRFPAGTHAMHYDWESQHYSKFSKNKSRHLATQSIDTFFAQARRCGAKVAYVVNVFDPPGKTLRLAEYLRRKGYSVQFWELGNEMGSKLPNVKKYLSVARSHADMISRVFENAEFGLTAIHKKFKTNVWNRALAKQDWCPNIIVHRYFGPSKKIRKLGLVNYIPGSMVYERMLKNSSPEPIDNITRVFPSKKFWITEWGLLFTKFDIQNSMAHGIWLARTYLRFVRTPEVKVAAYFNFNAPPFETVRTVNGHLVHRVTYYVNELINLVTTSATYTLRQDQGDLLSIQEYFDDNHKWVGDLIINAEGQSRTYQLPASAPSDSFQIDYIGSEDVMASNGHSMASSELLRLKFEEDVRPVNKCFNNKEIKIPSYSVAIVRAVKPCLEAR